jgi:hypothetical protein
MTSIKPPTPGSTGPHPLSEAANSAGSAKSSSESTFERALHQSGQAAQTSAVGSVATPAGADPVAALVREVEAGRLSMDHAVERLVSQTLASVGAHLNDAQRTELSGLLRQALTSDPTLLALRGAVSGQQGIEDG